MRRKLALIAVAATAATVATQVAVSPSAGACAPSWRAFAARGLPRLEDVAALSASDVWAVGETGPSNVERPRIVHWDGHTLALFMGFSPSVVSTDAKGQPRRSGRLSGVAAVSRDDIWAVGSDGAAYDSERPVVEHWDGRAWRVVSTPQLGSPAGLYDVTALSRDDVWAVGRAGSRPLYEHWDGRRWRAIVGERDAAMYAVDGAAPDDVWAVGSQGLLEPSVNDISGVSVRWDGRRWREVPDPQDTGDQEGLDGFNGVAVLSPTDVWGMRATYASRWDGRRWHDFLIPARSTSDALFHDIAAAGPSDLWGVGEVDFKYALIVHWSGKAWRTQPTPFQRIRGTTLNRLSVVTPTEIWAAGDHLLARYSCA